MSNYELISKEAVSNSEVLDILKKREKESEELVYREEKSLDYVKKLNPLSKKDFKTAKEELIALEIPRLEEEHIIKIIDVRPKDGTQLRAIVSTSGTVLVDENVNKILDILKKYN